MTQEVGNINNRARDLSPQIIKWRRELHRIPEVGIHLPLTCEYIKKCLSEMGADFLELPSSSSVLVRIRGALPGPVVGLRGDMDALPIKEQTGLSFAGENGNMHACGHDAHSAMLLGAIKLLLEQREQLCGEVKCLFQAGEENGQGARLAVLDGAWDNPQPDAMFAIHVTNSVKGLECGMLGIKEGVVMASSDAFTITAYGQGGHISDLEKLCNPVWALGDILAGIRDISREWEGSRPKTMIAASCLKAGDCFNAIPDTAQLKGGIRSMEEKARNQVKMALEKLCLKVGKESKCLIELHWETSNDCLINDGAVTAAARETAKTLFPGRVCEITEELLASEDIYHLFSKSPGSYIHLGCGFEDKREVFPLHNSHFCLNEDVLFIGSAILASCAAGWAKKKREQDNAEIGGGVNG